MNLLNAIKTVRLFKKQEELIPLKTKWSQQLDPNHVLEDYPRPQMKRDNYINLNGFYHYAINQQKEIPHLFQGENPRPLFSRKSIVTSSKTIVTRLLFMV